MGLSSWFCYIFGPLYPLQVMYFLFSGSMESKTEAKKSNSNLSGLRIEQVSGSVENAADGNPKSLDL